jgi:hypothetical protein
LISPAWVKVSNGQSFETLLFSGHDPVNYSTLDTSIMLRVKGRFTRRFLALSFEDLRRNPDLSNLSVIHGFQQTTNFKVTLDESKRIMEMIG